MVTIGGKCILRNNWKGNRESYVTMYVKVIKKLNFEDACTNAFHIETQCEE